MAVMYLLAVFTSGSCADGSELSVATVSDSAGVRVVTNSVRSIEEASAWSLSSVPTVDIGSGVNPDVSLLRVTSVASLVPDRVVIGMTSPPRVVVVGVDGDLMVELGGEGDGPGEFMGVGSVVPLGADSVAVWDPERRRVSVFGTDGRLLREVDLRDLAPLSWVAAPSMLVPSARTYLLPFGRSAWVLFGVGMLGPGTGVRRVGVPSYRISATGEELAAFGSFPGESTFLSDQTGVAPYPLGADTYGSTTDDALFVGTADAPELRRYSTEGALEQIVRWPARDREVGGDRLDAWSEFVAAFLEPMSPSDRADIQGILDLMPEPEVLPAYTGLVTTDSGEVWVGEYHPGQLTLGIAFMGRLRVPERRWLILGADGGVIATVRTPLGFRPMTVRGGRVWGVATDELDVEAVRAYDIVRG